MAAFLSDTWKSIKSTGGEIQQNVFGPDYSYLDHIPKPESKGVGEDGNFGQVSTNVFAAFDYVNVIGRTKEADALGNSFLVKTGGMCVTPAGELKERMNFVDNISSGGKKVERALGQVIAEPVKLLGYGLASGIIEDVTSLNPKPLMKAVSSDPTPACRKYQCKVTDRMNGDTGYITPSLNPDFNPDKCTLIPEGPPPNWQQADTAEIARIQKEIDETKQLLAKDKGNPDLIKRLYGDPVSGGGLMDDLQAAVDAKEGRQEKLDKFEKIKEDFGMSSPALGGVILAGLFVALLVFSKRA